AKRTVDQALRIVDKVSEPYSSVYAHLADGLYQMGRGDARQAVAAFEAAQAIRLRSQMELPIATAWLAAAHVQAGHPQNAISLLVEADRDISYKRGGMYNSFHHHFSMAQAHLALCNLDAAQVAITRAQEVAAAGEEIVHLAW